VGKHYPTGWKIKWNKKAEKEEILYLSSGERGPYSPNLEHQNSEFFAFRFWNLCRQPPSMLRPSALRIIPSVSLVLRLLVLD
jgi:hypothetical protein